ncbi:MAG: hypothetical protein EOO75_20000, partial [Myxococcales bacterium]
MSRRIRTIKPELLEDERTSTLSHGAWRLFVSCLLLADDHGNLRGGVAYLAAQVFWGSQVQVAAVTAWRDELVAVGLWSTYEVRSQTYVAVSGWAKHQRIDNAGKPQVPGPDGSEVAPSTPRRLPKASPAQVAMDLSEAPAKPQKPARRESPRVAASRREPRLEVDRDQEEEREQEQPRGREAAPAAAPVRVHASPADPADEPWITDEELAETSGVQAVVPAAPATPRCPVSAVPAAERTSPVTVLPPADDLAWPTTPRAPG